MIDLDTILTRYSAVLRRQPSESERAVLQNLASTDVLDSVLATMSKIQVDPIIRLYQSVFGRVPDSEGLDYWVTQSQNGMTLSEMSDRFAQSDEFIQTYQGLNNEQIVQQFYRNVLNREGEPTGVTNWTAALDSGATLASVINGFAQSQEFTERADPYISGVQGFLTDAAHDRETYIGSLFINENASVAPAQNLAQDTVIARYLNVLRAEPTAAEIQAFCALPDAATLDQALLVISKTTVDPIIRLYQPVFGRVPDSEGLDYWVAQNRSGMTLSEMSDQFAQSNEFVQTYQGMNHEQVVQQFYRNVLNREGEPTGVANWTASLDSGATLASVINGFAQSQEFTLRADPYISGNTGFLVDAINSRETYTGSLFIQENGFDTTQGGNASVSTSALSPQSPIVSGTTIAGATVTVTVAGATFSTIANSNGLWSINTVTSIPQTGTLSWTNNTVNPVSVTVTNGAVVVVGSTTQNVNYSGGSGGSGGGGSGGGGSGGGQSQTPATISSSALTNSATPTIDGTASPGATVTLTIGGATFTTTANAQTGAWSISTSTTGRVRYFV